MLTIMKLAAIAEMDLSQVQIAINKLYPGQQLHPDGIISYERAFFVISLLLKDWKDESTD